MEKADECQRADAVGREYRDTRCDERQDDQRHLQRRAYLMMKNLAPDVANDDGGHGRPYEREPPTTEHRPRCEVFSIVQPRDLGQVVKRTQDGIREEEDLEWRGECRTTRQDHQRNVQPIDSIEIQVRNIGSKPRHGGVLAHNRVAGCRVA